MPRIAAAVKKKSKDLPRYRQAVGSDDIHLLLVANHINNSGKLVVEEQAQLNLQGFKVVYFYPYPDHVVTIFNSGPDALGSASPIYVEASGTGLGGEI